MKRFNPLLRYGLDDSGQKLTNPLQFVGAITVAADFPTIAAVQNGWFYSILADVSDNDATKTNTGQSFLQGDEIAWNGLAWVVLGNHTQDFEGVTISRNGKTKGLCGNKTKILIDETVTIPENYEYNVFVLDNEGIIQNNGVINIM